MAIKNIAGNYLRILPGTLKFNLIEVEIYASEDSRRNGVGEFEQKKMQSVSIPMECYDAKADAEKTIMGNILTAQYGEVKKQFPGWEDC